VKAFAYDNKFRSLEDSSRDLARAIESWMVVNSERQFRITAHSLGTRISLGALGLIQNAGWLTGDVVATRTRCSRTGRNDMARWSSGFTRH
jgi:hypothetical protein